MAEATNAMIYDVLIAVQASVGRVEDGIRQTRDEVKGLCGDIAALQMRVSVVKRGIAGLRMADEAVGMRSSQSLGIIDAAAT